MSLSKLDIQLAEMVDEGSEDDPLSMNWTRRLLPVRSWPGWLRVCHAEWS
jgi:hypothetical protein